MTTKPQLGGNNYNLELEQARISAEAIRRALTELVEEPGPQTRAILIAKAALELSKITTALTQLDRIGRDAKKTT